MKDKENGKHICREYEMKDEVVENYKGGEPVTVSQRDRGIWQPEEKQETKQEKCGAQKLSQIRAPRLDRSNIRIASRSLLIEVFAGPNEFPDDACRQNGINADSNQYQHE